MELYSDAYYVQRIQAGDTECFACLIDRYSERVYALIVKVVRNREDAEELVQDVFMKVFKHLPSFKGDSSLATWIYRIAYNTAISETRKKKHELLVLEETQWANTSEEDAADAWGLTDSAEQVERLEKALERLSADERFLILLYYMEDKTVEEIAVISGLTQTNVKTKLFRIRKRLYSILTEMEKEEI